MLQGYYFKWIFK